MGGDVETTVLARTGDGVGHLTLNRPRAINALDAPMIGLLAEALDAWEHDTEVSIVLLDGAGERGFCAGGDVRSLREQILAERVDLTAEFFRAEYALNARIAEYPKPIVALADGVTMGGGIGLAGHAAVRIVTERSRLAMPETRIGFVVDLARRLHEYGTAAPRLEDVVNRIGRRLGLVCNVLSTPTAIVSPRLL